MLRYFIHDSKMIATLNHTHLLRNSYVLRKYFWLSCENCKQNIATFHQIAVYDLFFEHIWQQLLMLVHDMLTIIIFFISTVINNNTLRPRQNDRHFTDDTFKCIFLNGKVWISFKPFIQIMLCRLFVAGNNAGLLLIGPPEKNFKYIWIEMKGFSQKNQSVICKNGCYFIWASMG